MIDFQNLALLLCQTAKEGQTIYAVCPDRVRSKMTLALLSNMRDGDSANGKSYSIGQGTLYMVRPNDSIPKDGFAVSLVCLSEADSVETKQMLAWRDKAKAVVA